MSQSFGTFSTSAEESKKRTTPDRVLITRILKYTKPFHRNLAIAAIAMVVSALSGLASPYLHMVAIDDIITNLKFSAFIWWVPIFVVVTVGGYSATYIQTYQMRVIGEKVVARMRDDMMDRTEKISLRYFSEGEVGRIMSRTTTDANQVRIFLRMGMTTIITDATMILGALGIIFWLNLRLAFIAVSIIPVALVSTWLLGQFARKAHRRYLTDLAGVIAKMQENFLGMKVIKSFVREGEATKGFDVPLDKCVKSATRTVTISSSFMPLINVLRVTGTVLILYFGALMVLSGQTTIGMLVAFIEYQFQYFTPLTTLLTAYDQYQSAMAALERMFDLIDTQVEVKDPSPDQAVNIETIEEVKFENVDFGYDPKIPVVENISFSLEGSKKLALVGPTGAGKSTIINLIERFYNPLNGRIIVNGHDVKDISIASLRKHMSTVLQDSFLFSMSVKDNIRFGMPEAADEEVIEAAKLVGAHEFIMKLPRGYDYVLQEGSSNISIGQRQLISFARTLLINPKLLILDEATSSIDPYTELVIQNALKKLLENRMTIIIAHRLSTIRLCNEIIVIDKGKIMEKGTHTELMNKNGLYSSFYRMQFREEKGIETASTKI